MHKKDEKTHNVPTKPTAGINPVCVCVCVFAFHCWVVTPECIFSFKIGGQLHYPAVIKPVAASFQAAAEPPSPDRSTEEAGSEKEQPAEKNKQEKNAEPKQVRD